MRILEANVDDIGLGGVYSLVRNIILNNTSDDVIDVACYEQFEDRNRIKEFEKKGSTVYFIGYNGNKIVKQFCIFNRMRKLVQNGNYDSIHIHSDIANKLFVLGLAARFGNAKRIIMHSHASDVDGSNRFLKRLYHRLCRFFLPMIATDYMSCSEKATEWMFPFTSKARVKMLNNGVDINRFAYNVELRKKMRAELQIGEDVLIGHVGRFAYQKNHEFLLKFFCELKKEMPNSKLLLVGIGDLQDSIRDMARKMGVQESVIFYGSSPNVYELFQAMDVFVLPSHFEGLPIVGVEAQASGLPVVFSDKISCEAKIIDDVSFLSISPDSEKRWVNEVIRLSKQQRKDTTDIMESSGFSLSNTIRTLMLFYHEVRK